MGWFDPDYCEKRCPICTRARKGNRFARFLQAIENLRHLEILTYCC